MKKLLISFSGGRTSGYMLWYLFNEWPERDQYEKIVVFANTGKEAEKTLFFVDECSQEWNIPIVWVESERFSDEGELLSRKGYKTSHKVVTYETASRNGEPFEEMISVLGVPASGVPFCSNQLKTKPIESYLRSIGWNDYYKALGIRIDEPKRVNKNNDKVIYPFVDYPTTKQMVKEWWDKQSFDLDIHPDEGNCDNCWKKDFPRLARNMLRNPKSFEWWEEMEKKYGDFNPRDNDRVPPFNFYRENKSVLDIRKLAQMSQAELRQLTMFDKLDGCAESCEAF